MKSKKSVAETVQKELPDFAAEVEALSQEQLDDRLAALAKSLEEVQDAQDADEALETARETARDLAAPYRESKNVLRLKSRYIVGLSRDRGGK